MFAAFVITVFVVHNIYEFTTPSHLCALYNVHNIIYKSFDPV